jgi:hypothetical protein
MTDEYVECPLCAKGEHVAGNKWGNCPCCGLDVRGQKDLVPGLLDHWAKSVDTF